MEEKTNEILKDEALSFLEGHRKMVLTVLDIEKHPNSSLMLYAVDDDFTIYFGTCECFGKYKALQADNHVSVAVVQESIDPLQVVDIQGIAEEIPHEKTAERLAWFTAKNPAKYYVKDREDFVMFKIVPSGVRWLDATSGELQIHDLEL
ncbi:pyridoxamine 5'-phosphate oxidase family protein [Candidatus Kaiserbacteria bacterium]|nr:MAG: pyridoxamine 5'-phosphate oxidase family protein [Candidatus Kaiserbacteria bacterium]